MPSMISRSAPGMASAVSAPHASGTRGSSAPWITSVGTRSRRSASRRLPEAMIASIWRADAGRMEAAIVGTGRALAHPRLVERKARAADGAEHLHAARAMFPSRSAGAGVSSAAAAARRGGRAGRGAPVVDMIEVSCARRAGCSIASVCAIMPPSDAPTTCAASMSSASSSPPCRRPCRSGDRAPRPPAPRLPPRMAAITFGMPPVDAWSTGPTSRLSKRITRWPRRGEQRAELVVPVDHLRAEPHHQEERPVPARRRSPRTRSRSRWLRAIGMSPPSRLP